MTAAAAAAPSPAASPSAADDIHLDDELTTEAFHDLEGEGYDLEARTGLRRVAGIRTDLEDVTEVEYRQLRLERVVLIGVWTRRRRRRRRELPARSSQALAETAGSEVLDGLVQRREKPDPETYVGSGKAKELRDRCVASGADTVICDGELTPGQLRSSRRSSRSRSSTGPG